MLRNTFFMPPGTISDTADERSVFATREPQLDPTAVELPVDLFIQDDSIIVRAPIVAAGINDISVSVLGDELTITKTSSTAPAEGARYYLRECYWDKLSRSVVLPQPVDIDNTKATLNDGILTVNLPLKNRPKGKTIRVK
jgi:HSP20 family molecular chaperone IbpA